MNIEICKKCKYREYINYQKWSDNDKVLESVVCLKKDEEPVDRRDCVGLCYYDYSNGKWIECYLKEDKYKMTLGELNEKLKLNIVVEYNCPYYIEHKLYDYNKKE